MPDALESAEGMVKQVLTLATGSVGGVILLFDDDKKPGVQLAGSSLLMLAISLLAVSVAFGVLALGAITWQRTQKTADADAASVRYTTMIEMLTFAAGVVAVAVEVARG